jgi:hypothetical protein
VPLSAFSWRSLSARLWSRSSVRKTITGFSN